MASSRSWTNNCPECGKHVEILNGDFAFSMELHKQSHKSLEVVNNLNHTQVKIGNDSKFNIKYCNDFKEIVNNDDCLSFQQHAQKHKPEIVDALSDHSSTSSENRIRFQNKKCTERKEQGTPVLSSFVEAIFHTMPIGLKAHRGFISEKSCSQAFCNLCEITIEPIFIITEHLKTKLHEDNIIQVIKSLFASELQGQMEFVSFYDSNLCCNLCKSKIDLSSNNLHETVVNIFTHNAGKGHSGKKTDRSANSQCEKPQFVLRNLALMDPTLNENKNFIEHGINPYYKCKLCDKAISYSENEKELLNNFKGHLNSPGHNKSLDAVSLLNKWNDLNITGKENHEFVVTKQNIYCFTCSCSIGTNLDQLLAHVRANSAIYGKNLLVSGLQPTNPPNAQIDLSSSYRQETMQGNGKPLNQPGKAVPGEELPPSTSAKLLEAINIDDVKAQYKELQKTNATIKWNSRYLENENDGYKCKLCKAVMKCGYELKLLEGNIMSHIMGKKHKKQLAKELNDILDKVQISYAVVKKNRKFLMMKDEHVWCTSCDCKISTIPSADNVDSFTKCLLIHLKGSAHVKKKMVVEGSNPSTSNPSRESLQTNPQNLIKKSFDKLPKSYLRDLEFILISPIEGYLTCRLCNCTIHPSYLKEHLEDLQHIQGKVQAHHQHVMNDYLQNRRTLSSLLQNVDLLG